MKSILKKELNDLIGFSFNTENLGQRGIGDLIESYCIKKIKNIKNKNILIKESTSVKSPEDIQVETKDLIYKIDIKSHSIDKKFSMPNLISVDTLRKIYNDNNNYIIYIFVDYTVKNNELTITKINIRYIEELDWSILRISNIGRGQLQIKNANKKFIYNHQNNRDNWIIELKKNVINFKQKLIKKSEKCINLWENS